MKQGNKKSAENAEKRSYTRRILFLSNADSVLKERISDPSYNIRAFCNDMNMRRSTLYRKLRKVTGKTIGDYISLKRTALACSVLTNNPRMPDSALAAVSGFKSTRALRRRFNSVLGMKPDEYRIRVLRGRPLVIQATASQNAQYPPQSEDHRSEPQ